MRSFNIMSLKPIDITNAMQRYDKGERPFRFTKPRSWYVYDLKGEKYPLKYIYALATDSEPRSFNTSIAKFYIKSLGFKVLETKNGFGDLFNDFDEKVEESLTGSDEKRKKRLTVANRIPTKRKVEIEIFNRNPDVVAETLLRSNGICEECKNEAPFMRLKDGTPYLEVHHKIRLAYGGEDTVENAIAVCPNCHRKEHYG